MESSNPGLGQEAPVGPTGYQGNRERQTRTLIIKEMGISSDCIPVSPPPPMSQLSRDDCNPSYRHYPTTWLRKAAWAIGPVGNCSSHSSFSFREFQNWIGATVCGGHSQVGPPQSANCHGHHLPWQPQKKLPGTFVNEEHFLKRFIYFNACCL